MAKPVDNPIDTGIDLGFVNFIKHPSDPSYVVFRFKDVKRADYFEKVLTEQKIWFEKGEGDRKGKPMYLFGVHKDDYNKVQKLNFETEAANRSFFIKNNWVRWILLIVVGAFVALAIAGAVFGEKTVPMKDKIDELPQKTKALH